MPSTTPSTVESASLNRLEEILWVIQARQGDTSAFARLLMRFEQPILYYLNRCLGDPTAALDAHQQVWIEAYRGLPGLASPEAFRVWLYRIARAQAARFQRAAIVDRETLVPLEEHDAPAEDGGDAETAEAVHLALGQLPAPLREVLTLHYLQDLTLEEMATTLDRPVGTMKSRLFEARRALRRVLRDTRHE